MKITKEKIINLCDWVVEGCFYVLVAAVTFSTSIVEIAVVTMIVFWSLRKLLKRDFRVIDSVPARILGVYILWVILSCFNSGYANESFRGIFKWAEYGMVFIMMATTAWTKDTVRRFMYVLAGTIVIICSNGFYQYFTGEGLIRHRQLTHLDYMKRVLSSFVHPNDYASWLMVVTIILIVFLIAKKSRLRQRLAMVGLMVFTGLSLFLTKSRGAWIAFTGGFVAIGALMSKKAAAIFILILVVMLLLLPQAMKDRMMELADTKGGATYERVMLWKGAVNMIKVHPVLGFGVNTYSRNFPDYRPEGYVDYRYTHNSYLQMGTEIGIVGVLIFLAFLLSLLRACVKGLSDMSDGIEKSLAAGLVAGIVAFALNCVVDTHFYSVSLAVFFWMIMGLCYSLSNHAEKS